jgi:NADH-quinone oxidoreductase subunit M
MSALPLLSLLIAVPLVAGALCLVAKPDSARWIALIATLIDLAIAVWLWIAFDPNGAQWQFVENVPIGGGVSWALGIDGIALMLIQLTAFLMPICIGASWRSIQHRV